MSRRSSVVLGKSAKSQPVPIENKGESKTTPPERSHLAALLLLFAASGCAALIYEIVWFQLLQLVIGSSAVSLGLLLAAYMGGLCLGSAAFARLIPARRHPLRVYALLELGIAAFGILALFGVPWSDGMYVAGATSGLTGMVLRGVVAACLPVAADAADGRVAAGHCALGGDDAQGRFVAGLFLRRQHRGRGVGLPARRLLPAARLRHGRRDVRRCRDQPRGGRGSRSLLARPRAHEPGARAANRDQAASSALPAPGSIYVAIALSGMTALGAEVVWTRLLSLAAGRDRLHVLASFWRCFCWGCGPAAARARFYRAPVLARRAGAGRLPDPACGGDRLDRLHAGACRCRTGPSIHGSRSAPGSISISISRAACGPFSRPTLLWGASFPLALAGAAAEGEDPARLSGEVYAANTAGSIVGALAFSLVLIPAIGTRESQEF